MCRNHIGDIRLPCVVVMFAQPAIIAGVGGDAVQTEFGLRGINFVQEAMQGEDAGAFGFAEHFAGRHAMVFCFEFIRQLTDDSICEIQMTVNVQGFGFVAPKVEVNGGGGDGRRRLQGFSKRCLHTAQFV